MISLSNNRNSILDFIKLIASFFVVLIHFSFTGILGNIFDALARFAVPFFFAVAGFFSFGAEIKNIKKRIFKILFLYLFASIIYHLYSLFITIYSFGKASFFSYFVKTFSFENFISFLFFNSPFSSDHLWFLLALVYVYLIWLLIIKFCKNDIFIFVLSTFLLVIHLILGEVLSIFGFQVKIEYVRNFALFGLPFFGFGYLINKHQNKFNNVNFYALILLLVFGCAESVLSNFFLGKNELYLGSICCCFSLIIIALKHSEKKLNRILTTISSTNTDIYIYHIVIAKSISFILGLIGFPVTNLIFKNFLPIAVCIICIIFSLIKNFILSKLFKAQPYSNKKL